jgi:lysozyme family protein
MTDLVALQKANDQRWHDAHITRGTAFNAAAAKAFKNKSRYVDVVRRCRALGSNMPDEAWVFIAVVHNRESSMDFTTHLGQGDPLNKKTTHVPEGRGPFFGPDAFEQGAVDALVYCAPRAAVANKDWSVSGMLTYAERYNGLAYANVHTAQYPNGAPSPYIWAGTNEYVSGKVLVDHGPVVWSTVDPQLGCAGLLLAIDALDDGVNFGALPRIPSVPLQPSLPAPDLVPVNGVFDAVWLQTSLNNLGATPRLSVDGINGAGTRTAVRAFQDSHGLIVDGIVGPATIAAIKAALTPAGAVIPKPPEIKLPPPGQVRTDLAPTFWGRVKNLFKPKGT